MRYYIGVDWADEEHAVWVEDEQGQRVSAGMVPHSPVGFSEWGRQLDEWRAQGIALWAAIERPEGRVVDCLLDHGVKVYPVNPKALDRARDRFRQSGAKDDLFDARVLAGFLRTDHAHLMALEPSSEAAQELKLLTEDYQRQVRTQTRLVNQLTATLKAYYPRALDVAELTTALASAFLQAYPTPATLMVLTERQWQRWAKAHHLSEARTTDLWTKLQQPQLPVPPLCRPTPGTGRQAQVWRWFLHCLFRFLRRIVHRFAPGSSGSGALLEQSLVEGRPPRAGQKQQNSSGQQTPVQVTRTPAAPRDLHPEGRDDHLERE